MVGASTAAANPTGSDTVYAGSGSQYGTWNLTQKRLRLFVNPTTQMSTDRCMDAQLDWRVTSGHYDTRVVRSCMPGGFNETDPTGNGYWEEPSGWTSGEDMRRGYGYMIDDDYGLFGWSTFDIRKMDGTQGSALQEPPPRTLKDCWARTRTRYQDGHVEATPNNGAPNTVGGDC